MKLNKKQQQVYNWLLSKPGYLKKGAVEVSFNQKFTNNITDVDIALKQARIDYKKLSVKSELVTPVIEKSVKIPSNATSVNIIKSNWYDINNVLCIADTHEPFCKEGYLEHCKEVKEKYHCGTVVHLGDEVDLCAISQWEKDPDGFSAGTEAELAQLAMEKWYKAFPNTFVCIGNHTARPFRLAITAGLPKKFLKTYEEAWNAPKGWKWSEHWEFNGTLYTHGTGMSGEKAAITLATRYRQNVVLGHIHSSAGIQYNASKIDLVWGMQLGGAIDDKSYAAAYAKDQLKKSIVGCGVVLNGKLPVYEPMIL